MFGRKTIIRICMLCALAITAVAAQSASAVNNNTAFTCVENGGAKDFSKAHCKKEDAVTPGTGKFGHVEIAPGTVTEIEPTSEVTPGGPSMTKLKTLQSGVTIEFQSPSVSGTGTLINKAGAGTEMWTEFNGKLTYSDVTVTAPAGKACVVKGGAIITNTLKGTTKGFAHELRIEPETGETFAEFTVEGCSIGALNHVWTLKGSVKGTVNGATLTTTHESVTAQNSLFFSGQKAGIDGPLTFKVLNGNPISTTTTAP